MPDENSYDGDQTVERQNGSLDSLWNFKEAQGNENIVKFRQRGAEVNISGRGTRGSAEIRDKQPEKG